jgi:hypothetical protein
MYSILVADFAPETHWSICCSLVVFEEAAVETPVRRDVGVFEFQTFVCSEMNSEWHSGMHLV